MREYPPLSRLLHRAVLGSRFIKEVAFDMDCLAARPCRSRLQVVSPVFVAALARAGTTILLEALYSTGVFASLTYRDMPFITAPYLWSRLARRHKASRALRERAHGDGLYIGYDSPEAFEEVFWMTFSKAAYIRGTYIEPQEVDAELIEKYRTFVGNILCRQQPPLRYLSKNNNNLIRIRALKAAFPDAVIIVPFRNPLVHAKSLLNQHRRFLQRHAQEPFSLKYMNLLGHFEFGANFIPFKVSPDALPRNGEELLELHYWLRYWKSVYGYVIREHANEVVFFDHDKLRERPRHMLAALSKEVLVEESLLEPFLARIRPPEKPPPSGQPLSDEITAVYNRLQELSI